MMLARMEKYQKMESTTNDLLISIIVPVYNRKETLRRCIDSILDADYKNIELIIIDDGSTDGSWDIIQSYSDDRIKSAHVTNGGVTVARNLGLTMATGDYVHFVDSDDFIESDIYTACGDVMRNHFPDMMMFDYSVYFESYQTKYNSQSVAIPQQTLLAQKYIRENILPVMVNLDSRRELFIETFVWNKFFKLSIIKQNHIRFDESRRRWEDRLFQVLFLKYADTFYYLPRDGYNYVLGHSSFSQNYDSSVFNMVLRGDSDYAALVGDLYNFDTPYSKNYYCKVFINTALQQFSIKGVDKNVLKSDISTVILTDRAQRMFDVFTPETDFEESIKDSILAKKPEVVFRTLNSEYLKREQEKVEATKKQHSMFRRIKNKIKRLVEK